MAATPTRERLRSSTHRTATVATTGTRFTLLLVGITAAFLGPIKADAQLGDLLKRKAKEAIKGPKKEDSTVDDAAIRAINNIYADPDVVPITEDQLVRFEKALKFEVSERDAILKEKSPSKTPEEFQTCSGNTAMSPEASKIAENWAKANTNATSEQLLKGTEKMAAEISALVAKKCGEDPSDWPTKHEARLRDVVVRASDIAMPPGWVPRTTGQLLLYRYSTRRTQGGADAFDSDDRFNAIQMPHPFLRAYAVLKERLIPFCRSIDLGLIVIKTGSGGTDIVGWRVPAMSPGDQTIYIYTDKEAAFATPKCPSLLPWLKLVE